MRQPVSEVPPEQTLASLVRNEATRMLAEAQLLPDPALVALGWERRFITDATRAPEVIQLYRQLGFEVRLEPVPPEQPAGPCEACQLVMLLQFRTVYTRRAV